jgi:regulator of sirC expression with transglutaminase-like and TPR domain
LILETLRARSVFNSLAALDESVFPLDRCALALALDEYPNLDIEAFLRRLNHLAVRVEVLRGDETDPLKIIECLNAVLFVEEGFRGNIEDYYDPRNSYLNEVLERKVGIPISLSVIYMEVARRIGFSLRGVGLPGHFIVKYATPDREILIDPFGNGRIISSKNCQEMLDQVFGGKMTVQPAHLQPMDKKSIITRMLFNLKGIYYQREEHLKAIAVVDRILMLNPGTPSEIRDRGMLYMQTSLFAKALADLEYYLRNSTGADDTPYVENHVQLLRRIVGCCN